MDSIRFFRVSFWNSSGMKVLASWFFGLDAFLWSRLFLGLELEDFHGFYQVFFWVSFIGCIRVFFAFLLGTEYGSVDIALGNLKKIIKKLA